MRNKKGYSSSSQLYPPDLAQFVSSLLCCDAVHCEAALGIIHKAEVLASLLDADDIHEAGWVCSVRSNFVVNLDEALHHDSFCLACIQGILQTVSEEDDERKRVSQFVRTGRRSGSIGTGKFVKEPV